MKNRQYGYTLIEVLTVTMILVIVGGIIAGIVTSVIQGTNKSNISTAVGQNGTYALSVITNKVVSAKTVVDVNPFPSGTCRPTPTPVQTLTVTTKDVTTGLDVSTLFSCASNTITAQTGGVTTNLTDTSQVRINATLLTDCYFTCTQESVFSAPVIEVGFRLTELAGGFFDQQSSNFFKTSIQMRNYTPN